MGKEHWGELLNVFYIVIDFAESFKIVFLPLFVFVILLRIKPDFIEILFVIFVTELQSFLIVFVIFYHNFILFIILRNIKIKCKILIFFGFVNFFHIFLIFIIKEFLVFPNVFPNFLFFSIFHQLHFSTFWFKIKGVVNIYQRSKNNYELLFNRFR